MVERKSKIGMIKDWNSLMELITFYISKGIPWFMINLFYSPYYKQNLLIQKMLPMITMWLRNLLGISESLFKLKRKDFLLKDIIGQQQMYWWAKLILKNGFKLRRMNALKITKKYWIIITFFNISLTNSLSKIASAIASRSSLITTSPIRAN